MGQKKKFSLTLKLPAEYEPYRGILLFVATLLIANTIWKFSIHGDDGTTAYSSVLLWGMDVTFPFQFLTNSAATHSYNILKFIGQDLTINDLNIIKYHNGNAIRIVWSCSGLKQMYIFICIILFSRGNWKKKIFAIPIGLVIIYGTNILRILIITSCIENHKEWFHLLHEYITKYGFYIIIFLLWVIWDEVLSVNRINH
jgi:exosortase/archaeosortase family protein